MDAPTTLVDWVCVGLINLGIDVTEESARYILAIETLTELEDYMYELLDRSLAQNKKFVNDLLERKRVSQGIPPDVQCYKKKATEDSYFGGKEKSTKKRSPGDPKTKDVHNRQSPVFLNGSERRANADPDVFQTSPNKPPVSDSAKRKQKFVSLYSKEGQEKSVIRFPGRHVCECQAAKHALVNNCLQCGRVVCEQEGSGLCQFCGRLVCTQDQQEVLARGSKKSEKLRRSLLRESESSGTSSDRDLLPHQNSVANKGLEAAMKHKDKLLEYDKTSIRRTHVIDDEADYFSSDSKWLSKTDKEALRKREEELRAKKYGSRLDRKMQLDFAGREVSCRDEDTINLYDSTDEVVQQVHFGAKPKRSADIKYKSDIINPTISQPAPLYVPPDGSYSKKVINPPSASANEKRTHQRLQDAQLQQMSDDGVCLSMHQPWASLLVKGIKQHEGRSWYTPHRGRLWIAATAKVPTMEDITDLERSYIRLYNDPGIVFPNHYPSACLLGCVDLLDCLAQSEYLEEYPEGESTSEYVFICQNPQELLVKFPMKGQHKIYKVEPHVLQGAKKGLRDPATLS